MTRKPRSRRSAASRAARAAHAAHLGRPMPGCPLCLRPTPLRGVDRIWISRRPI